MRPEQFVVALLGQAVVPDMAFEQHRGSTDTLPGLDTFSTLHFPVGLSCTHVMNGPEPHRRRIVELFIRSWC